ncbi:MAG: dTDP-4-dehydrorhamnose reductase [Aliidiomarina sp.]|uniref:dTDP-4-dehydrorhamnose reductase n=1 Tax=Aliidiomarina sp. TaxID=1872439 RepID=UPI0025BE7641|nr:dTDP-4-dehydrorhamnose reductase [Aliidiomarina sp.]MCH8502444.1 dTDP-4-dehydrorhamnose reductase [Aliidiomarina sp.]
MDIINGTRAEATEGMERIKIFLTGGKGQVGFELARHFNLIGDVYAPTRAELDLSDLTAVQAYLDEVQPSLVLNAAAYTAVDRAETDQTVCWQLNVKLPELLATYCRNTDSAFIHFSSDYVYSGAGEHFRHEHESTQPINFYGRSKLAGDQAVAKASRDNMWYILRTSWVYSARGNNFMKTMLRLGASKHELNVVNDQIGAPTPARLLALSALLLTENMADSGVYHVAPRGETSWQGFAQEIFRQALAAGVPLAITPDNVFGIASEDYPTPAQRPLNSRLDVSALESAVMIDMPSWQSELALTLAEYLDKQ